MRLRGWVFNFAQLVVCCAHNWCVGAGCFGHATCNSMCDAEWGMWMIKKGLVCNTF